MIKILIADDHPVVRKGLKQIIEESYDMAIVDEAGSGQQVLEKVRKNTYNIVILDISMPGRTGLDILKDLKNAKPHIHILILSIYPEEQYALRSLKEGASGYLTKESATDELASAIKKVMKGEKYVSYSLAEKIVFNFEKDNEKPLHETLSNREYEVMCLIGAGKTVKEISKKLSLSTKTIYTYRYRILEKMNMKDNAEIIRYTIQNRLAD